MAPRDGPERVPQREVLAEVGLLELARAPPPVIRRKLRHPLHREAVGENSRLHRTVREDARPVLRAPRDLPLGYIPADQGEGGLQ